MRAQGVIEPTSSNWTAPIVVIRKKEGSIQLYVDYRQLNSISLIDAYPMPTINDLIDLIEQTRFISTLDRTKGYWQVPAREKDCVKTVFACSNYGGCRLACKEPPATFQRMMDHLLDGLRGFAGAYLDDSVVFSQT